MGTKVGKTTGKEGLQGLEDSNKIKTNLLEAIIKKLLSRQSLGEKIKKK